MPQVDPIQTVYLTGVVIAFGLFMVVLAFGNLYARSKE
jgi:multisubunit Na+/H+ antiporter MnhC subunit